MPNTGENSTGLFLSQSRASPSLHCERKAASRYTLGSDRRSAFEGISEVHLLSSASLSWSIQWSRQSSEPLADLPPVALPEARTRHGPAEYVSSNAVSLLFVPILTPGYRRARPDMQGSGCPDRPPHARRTPRGCVPASASYNHGWKPRDGSKGSRPMRGGRCRSSAARANRWDCNGFLPRALSGTEAGCGAPVGGWFSQRTQVVDLPVQFHGPVLQGLI